MAAGFECLKSRSRDVECGFGGAEKLRSVRRATELGGRGAEPVERICGGLDQAELVRVAQRWWRLRVLDLVTRFVTRRTPGSGSLALRLKRATGIEPVLRAWKALVQPLHHARGRPRLANVLGSQPSSG